MREIKFRGQNFVGGEWIYGFYVREMDGTYYIATDWGTKWDGNNCLEYPIVTPETIGQYTGLKDKNGKEIYEGDIVKRLIYTGGDLTETEFAIGEIWWSNDKLAWCIRNADKMVSLLSFAIRREMEIIGNIHENPELMEV